MPLFESVRLAAVSVTVAVLVPLLALPGAVTGMSKVTVLPEVIWAWFTQRTSWSLLGCVHPAGSVPMVQPVGMVSSTLAPLVGTVNGPLFLMPMRNTAGWL